MWLAINRELTRRASADLRDVLDDPHPNKAYHIPSSNELIAGRTDRQRAARFQFSRLSCCVPA
jgi:hypothetical protein